jgi:hypothetical protein
METRIQATGCIEKLNRMRERIVLYRLKSSLPEERRKRERPRTTWMKGVQAAMTARNL